VWLTAPEPNTWRELMASLDARQAEFSLAGARVAVQEYGATNPELLAAFDERGAEVTRVPVYQWALPEDRGPLEAAVHQVAAGEIDVALFTTGTQAVHLFQVAEALGMRPAVEAGFRRVKVASIGPTTSEELRQRGIRVDVEASHPKMGFLVREAAD
jgi:uroporphyrinogen-III synthase